MNDSILQQYLELRYQMDYLFTDATINLNVYDWQTVITIRGIW